MLTMDNRPCLVVGGGGVALRKLDALLANGAEVTVNNDPDRETEDG